MVIGEKEKTSSFYDSHAPYLFHMIEPHIHKYKVPNNTKKGDLDEFLPNEIETSGLLRSHSRSSLWKERVSPGW